MKPLTLSKKSNPLGNSMSLPDAFAKLKNTKHDSSFKNLGDWLNNSNSKPGKMKSMYKIAASFVLTALIFIACSIPVQHEEEIGYMIIGMAETEGVDITAKLKESENTDLNQVIVNDVIFEQESGGYQSKYANEKSKGLKEIVLVLPTSDYNAAVEKKTRLESIFTFQNIDILPIEEKVERPFYEVALHSFDVKVGKDIADEVVEERINAFLHENSQTKGDAKITINEHGNRVVEVAVNLGGDNYEIKRSVEGLYNDLAGKKSQLEHMTKEEKIKLKEREIEKMNAAEKAKQKQQQ